MDHPTAATADDRITLREVSAVTGLPRKRVLEAARLGHLVAFVPPPGVGGLTRYSRRSAEALAASMVTGGMPHPRPEERTDVG